MQKMNEKEAIEMLKAKLTCMKLEALSCIEKGCDKDCECCEYNYTQGNMGEQKEALDIAIQSLEEIQQYRAIGTVEELQDILNLCESLEKAVEAGNALVEEVKKYQAAGSVEECREAVEMLKPKKVRKIQIPNTNWCKAHTRFECPSCNIYLNYRELSHCGMCGQKLLWEE